MPNFDETFKKIFKQEKCSKSQTEAVEKQIKKTMVGIKIKNIIINLY